MNLNKKYLLPTIAIAVIFLICGAATLGSELIPETIPGNVGNIAMFGLLPAGLILMVCSLKLVGVKRKSEKEDILGLKD